MKSRLRNIISFSLFFLLIVFCSIFSVSNKIIIKINFFLFLYFIELPLYILIFSLIFIGFLLGFLFFYLRKSFIVMKPKDYVFCALDFSDLDETLNFANKIYKDIGGLKVGLELFVKYGIEGVLKIQKFGIPIFLDLKFNDIPNTVKKSVENVLKIKPDLMTIHLTGGSKMINEVCKIKGNTKIIGVSLLIVLIRMI